MRRVVASNAPWSNSVPGSGIVMVRTGCRGMGLSRATMDALGRGSQVHQSRSRGSRLPRGVGAAIGIERVIGRKLPRHVLEVVLAGRLEARRVGIEPRRLRREGG